MVEADQFSGGDISFSAENAWGMEEEMLPAATPSEVEAGLLNFRQVRLRFQRCMLMPFQEASEAGGTRNSLPAIRISQPCYRFGSGTMGMLDFAS